jgi:hypothetical protein
MPKLKIAVLSPLLAEDIQAFKLDKQEASAGTYIVLMPRADQEEEK